MNTETPKVVRLGGALLAVSMLVLMVIVPLYLLIFGAPDGTGRDGSITAKDYALHLMQSWSFASAKWAIEVCAIALMAVASFQLSRREVRDGGWLSPSLTWSCVAVGALCAIPMYFIMLGGYLPAAQGIDTDPTVYPVLRGIATVVFGFGFAIIHLGLAGSFWVERVGNAIPSWVATLGFISNLIASLMLFLVFIGLGSLQIAGPFGFIGYSFGIVLGVAIWRDR